MFVYAYLTMINLILNCSVFPRRLRSILALCGGILIHLTLGTIYTFGNMNPYLTSYLRSTSNPSLQYSDTLWIFAVGIMSHGSTMWLGGVFHSKFGARTTCLIGSVTVSFGMFMTYFSIKHSFAAVVFTYGLLFGLGIGPAYAAPMGCAMKWFPSHKGVVNGIIVSGFGAGALIFDQVQTAYINPENFKPNVTVGSNNERYFDQKVLLNRVPGTFLMLGAVYTVMQFIGIILLNEAPTEMEKATSRTNLINPPNSDDEIDVLDRSEIVEDKGPKDLIQNRDFWILWFMFLVNAQSVTFVSSLYKSYGETFISNDHFLAIVGSFAAVFNGGGRIFWGYLADRRSFRFAMILLCSSSVFLFLTFKLTEKAGSWMYFIWVCLIFGTFSGNYALFPTVMAKSFGQKYFTINYGLLFSSQVFGGPIAALASEHFSGTLGWLGLFGLVAAFSFVGLILVFFLRAKKPNGEYI